MSQKICCLDPYDIEHYNQSITLLYRDISKLKIADFVNRLAYISSVFLGYPYVLGAAGEGQEGRFDQAPLYRLDSFDCVTYVNTVLALALSQEVFSFQKNLIHVAYRNSQLEYEYRHHFMSVDWNFYNQLNGIVKDITMEIVDASGGPIAHYAEALIDRPGWFRKRSYDDIRLLRKISSKEEKSLLEEMHNIAGHVEAQHSRLPYLPLSEMFDGNNQPKHGLFLQIPHGAVIEVVRPNWDLKDKIGTNLNVSHVGFAIWKGNDLFYRQASSIEGKVSDVLLIEYLQSFLSSLTVKGINIQKLTAHPNCPDIL